MNAFKKIKDRFVAYRRYRRTVIELRNLNDRELRDMGLSRNDIEYVAKAACNRAYHTTTIGG